MTDAVRCILALSLAFGLPLMIGFIVLIAIWCEAKDPDEPKLKFSAFKKFYALNPNRWDLSDCWVACCGCKSGSVYTHFGFIDFYRYKLWYRRRQKNLEKKDQAEALANIIAAVKKDIENAELHAQFQYGKAMKILWKVGENHE